MNMLKILGGIGLVVLGGVVLLLNRKDNENNCPEESNNEPNVNDDNKSIDEIIAEKYEKFSETDENPYNVKGCVVPPELVQRDRAYQEKVQTPIWVEKGKVCAEAGSRIGTALLDFVSMGYDFYNKFVSCGRPRNIYGYQNYNIYGYSGGYSGGGYNQRSYQPQCFEYIYDGHRVVSDGRNELIF